MRAVVKDVCSICEVPDGAGLYRCVKCGNQFHKERCGHVPEEIETVQADPDDLIRGQYGGGTRRRVRRDRASCGVCERMFPKDRETRIAPFERLASLYRLRDQQQTELEQMEIELADAKHRHLATTRLVDRATSDIQQANGEIRVSSRDIASLEALWHKRNGRLESVQPTTRDKYLKEMNRYARRREALLAHIEELRAALPRMESELHVYESAVAEKRAELEPYLRAVQDKKRELSNTGKLIADELDEILGLNRGKSTPENQQPEIRKWV